MSNSYSSLCDDFYLDMCVNTELELPSQRDTILTFFERVQKQFPSMGNFSRRNNTDCCLQGDRSSGRYRWVALEADRVASGVVNPDSFESAYEQDRLVLDLMPYMLGINHLDVDSLDVTFAMDFEYSGNHDEVITEALLNETAFGSLLDLPSAKPIVCSPSIVVSLSEDCRTQARCSVESRTSIFEPDIKEQPSEEAICLSLTVRQYPSGNEKFDAVESFAHQCRMAEELMAEKIVPNFVQPLVGVIAQKRLT
ncbi:MAG: hypothetical protein ACYSWP_17145 [Planctomycetota bacterium]|jgi:hypothetical protein